MTAAGAGTLTAPDANGYYTITLTGVRIPATAAMLAGGVEYTYSLTSAPPRVQTNERSAVGGESGEVDRSAGTV